MLLIPDTDGVINQAVERTKHTKGAYCLGSATNTDATYRIHGEDKCDLGYNVNLAATDNFVREIRADTGAQPDPVGIPDLIRAQTNHHDLTPAKLIYDSAVGTGRSAAQIAQVSNGQTQLVIQGSSYRQAEHTLSSKLRVIPKDSIFEV